MKNIVKILFFVTCFLSVNCASFQSQPCQIEKQLVNTMGVGLAATDAAIGDSGGDEYKTAMRAARGVRLLGSQAVRACELARDGAAWQQWIMLAVEAVGAVVGIIEGANEEITQSAPSELLRALEALRNESNEAIIMAQ